MYLYFDKNGILKEVINDKALRQGNYNVNKIYIYIDNGQGQPELDPTQPHNIYVKFRLKDGTVSPDIPLSFTAISQSNYQQIPYNPKRDLKYFKYEKKYPMYGINLQYGSPTDPSDIDFDALEQEGPVALTIRIAENGLNTLGLVVFNVEESTDGEKEVQWDEYVSLAQFSYLLNLLSQYYTQEQVRDYINVYVADNYYNKNEVNVKLSLKADKSDTYTKSETNTLLDAKADKSDTYTKAQTDSAIASAITNVYRYKGSVPTYDDLPTSGQVVGDVYNIEDSGDNYAWTGTEWDKLASSVLDLRNYYNKDQTDILLSNKSDKVGPLPSYSVNGTDNVLSFINTNQLDRTPIVLKVTSTIPLATGYYKGEFFLSGPSYSLLSFNFETFTDNSIFRGTIQQNVATVNFNTIFSLVYLDKYEETSNKVTSLSSSSTDTEYPSAKLVYDQLALKEDVANKVTSLSSSSTDTEYPSAKAVYDVTTNIRNVAEGKCKTFVVSTADTIADLKTKLNNVASGVYYAYKISASTGTEIDITTEVKNGDYDSISLYNGNLRTQTLDLELAAPSYPNHKYLMYRDYRRGAYVLVDYAPITNNYSYFHLGDILLIIETEYPDRWFGDKAYRLYAMETTKVNLSNYYAKNANLTPTTTNAYDLGSSTYTFKDAYLSGYLKYNKWSITEDTSTNLLHFKYEGNNRFYLSSSAFVGASSGAYDLGTSSSTWKDLYLGGKVYLASNYYITYASAASSIAFYSNNTLALSVGATTIYSYANLVPQGSKDLGNSSYRWTNLFISNLITDGGGSIPGVNDAGRTVKGLCGGYISVNPSSNMIILEYDRESISIISADTTIDLDTQAEPANCYPEYRLDLMNEGASNHTITLPSGTKIKTNDDNITISGNTFVLPASTTVEINIKNTQTGLTAIVFNWAA